MVFVKEILRARLEDNQLDAKKLRDELNMLQFDMDKESNTGVISGIEAIKTDLYFEYESLRKENVEIRAVLKLIDQAGSTKKDKKKRAYSSLATGRLNSHRYSKSLSSL